METNLKSYHNKSRVIRRAVNFQYPSIDSKDGLNIHIQHFELVDDKFIITFRIEELESDNFSVQQYDDQLVITIEANKQYSLYNKRNKLNQSEILKYSSTYSSTRSAEVTIPGENYSLSRTINFPENKLLKLVFRRNN